MEVILTDGFGIKLTEAGMRLYLKKLKLNGFLYAVKITPKKGKPYFLVRADGSDGNFIRADKPEMRIPSWEIFSW